MVWLRVAAFVIVAGAIAAAAWTWAPGIPATPDELVAFVAPHRDAWYALPTVVMAFVLLGLVLFPVLALIGATGIAFGPVLGPVYAMAGSVASAASGFAIGRWLGRRRTERLMSDRLARISGRLRRNGTLAVFLVRKVPAPFTLVNIALGASAVHFRNFVAGTVLGIAPAVVALAGFGSQLTEIFTNPSPETLARAGLFVAIPLTVAVVIDRTLRRPGTCA
jgi:phospholipase D1/2